MNLSRTAIGYITLIYLAIGFSSCERSVEGTTAESQKAGKPLIPVETITIKSDKFRDYVDVVGSLEAKQQTEVKFEYPGIITDVFVDEWVFVNKGQALAKLDTRETEVTTLKAKAALESARANVLQVEAQTVRAQREYERAQKLKESGLITQQAFEDIETGLEAASAGLAAAKAQLALAENEVKHAETVLSKAVLRAPIDGFVALSRNHVGDAVVGLGSGDPDFRIVDNRVLKLVITVPSSQINRIKLDQPVIFDAGQNSEIKCEGKVRFINPVIDLTNRSVKVTVEVDNSAGELRAGLFVKGQIITGEKEGVIRIPKSALLSWNLESKTALVFLVKDSKAVQRSVQTGTVASGYIEITDGLTEGEQLITRGAFNVRDGEPVLVTQATGE